MKAEVAVEKFREDFVKKVLDDYERTKKTMKSIVSICKAHPELLKDEGVAKSIYLYGTTKVTDALLDVLAAEKEDALIDDFEQILEACEQTLNIPFEEDLGEFEEDFGDLGEIEEGLGLEDLGEEEEGEEEEEKEKRR